MAYSVTTKQSSEVLPNPAIAKLKLQPKPK